MQCLPLLKVVSIDPIVLNTLINIISRYLSNIEGVVEDFDGVVKLWKHAYEEMRLHPSELPLYLTESVNNPPEKRQKTLRYLFEELKVPSVSLCDTAYCHLRSAGRSTGVVVDCSYGLTSITPVIEGCSQRSASLTLDVGGYQLTAFMCNLAVEFVNPILTLPSFLIYNKGLFNELSILTEYVLDDESDPFMCNLAVADDVPILTLPP